MANRRLKRYKIEGIARILIATGFLLMTLSWVVGVYYFGITGKAALFIGPLIFTCVLILLLLAIRYRYALFEKYPYLINLPSIFYHIGDGKKGAENQSKAFSMIFTVHALVVAFMGLLSLVLTISIGLSIKGSSAPTFLYSYMAIIAILIVSVLFQYRRIYIRFVK